MNEAAGKPATKSSHAGCHLNQSDSANWNSNKRDNDTNVRSSGSAMKPAPKKYCAGRASTSKSKGRNKNISKKDKQSKSNRRKKCLDEKRI